MSVREWYADRDVLVTGGTGQLGRILLEKLLRVFPKVRVHLLLRSKDGVSSEDRVKKKMLNSSGFERLRQERPNAADRIYTYEGDLLDEDLGLPQRDQRALVNVSIVFHAATASKSECLLKFCKQLPNLQAVVVANEIFRYQQDQIPEKLLKEDSVPSDLPLGLVRLPPLAPAVREPMPGHVELLNGPTAMMIGAGRILGRTDLPAEIIPLDLAANTLIVTAWDIAQRKNVDEPIVYNASTIECTWGEIIRKGGRASNKFGYPTFCLRGMTSSVILYWIAVTLFEWLPSYICDTFLYLVGREQAVLAEYRRVRGILKSFEPVTLRRIVVARRRIKELISKCLSPEDLELFPLRAEFDLEAYILCAAAAARRNCVDENNLRIVRFFVPTILLLLLLGCSYYYYFRK